VCMDGDNTTAENLMLVPFMYLVDFPII